MRRVLFVALLLAPCLRAQVVLTAGDTRVSLVQVLRPHPEGLFLTLPDAQGRGLDSATQAALEQEPALALQLTMQALDRASTSGRELAALGGWDSTRPHWALLGPGPRIYAEGTEAPSATALAEAYGRSPLRTRADTLREFLRANPDQGEAQAQLLLQLRDLAERRAEAALASRPKDHPLLGDEGDDRIWGEYADRYERFFNLGIWRDADPGASSPVLIAAKLSVAAEHSPRLRELAARLMPAVEEALRDKPSETRRWDLWLSFREAGARGSAGAVLAGLDPLPGARRWPPEAAVDAFVEDAQQSGDWREAEPVLQAAFDANEAFLRQLEAAAKEDAGPRGGPVDMGGAFGFGQWNGEVASLVEAKLHLGKPEEADRIFQRVFARVPRPEFAEAAAQLARDCGAEALADKWARMGKPGN
ncbi:MAG TPA: hypothetical protein VL181_06050 [Holophagaceae bacterium]|nr:hypothetical protein [Holophagaceae bacterium]